MIIIYFYSSCQVELCLQTCVGYSDIAQIGPTGWNYHEEHLNLDSDYKQSPQEIVFQAELLWNFSWGSLSSTFEMPARLNSVSRHALSSLRCSDRANRLGIIMTEFLILSLNYKQSPQEIVFQSNLLWNFSHEDDYHLLLQCLPGWIMSPNMRWVFWHAQIVPTGWKLSWRKIWIWTLIQAITTRNHFSSRPPLKFLMRITIIYF